MRFHTTLPLFFATLLPLTALHAQSAEENSTTPEPAVTETAVFGAGCFWCVEAFYLRKPGVLKVVSGFAGGTEPNPTYEQVVAGETSHAEVVEVTFDPRQISYRELVDFFWQTHDPTDPRGVAPDFGPHYRSTILYASPEQQAIAKASKATLEASGTHPKPIITRIEPLDQFYPAEDYHQDFANRNPNHPYVQRILLPKLKKIGLDLDPPTSTPTPTP